MVIVKRFITNENENKRMAKKKERKKGRKKDDLIYLNVFLRGGEWYLEKRGSRKILTGSRNLGSVFDKSRSLVFAWFVFTFFESRNFLPKSLGLGFLTKVSASRRVSDFIVRHPLFDIPYLFFLPL